MLDLQICFMTFHRYLQFYDPAQSQTDAAHHRTTTGNADTDSVTGTGLRPSTSRLPPWPRRDPTPMVSWLFDHVNKLASTLYNPRRQVSIDETMVKHKGRTRHRQYMPNTPCKWGLKSWVLAESATGYVLQIIPYFGRDDRSGPTRIDDVIINLKGLLKLYFIRDSMSTLIISTQTCVKIIVKLVGLKTYACGTLRMNRTELPKSMMTKKHKELKNKGDCIFTKSNALLLSLWLDRKIIRILSSIHGTRMTTVKRTVRGSDGKFVKTDIPCPVAVRDYCHYMGGVDLCDQLYSYYCFGRKSQKWTKEMEIMKLNAYVMYSSLSSKKVSLFDCTLALIQELNSTTTTPMPTRSLSENKEHNRLTSRCLPDDLERKSFCRVCYQRTKNGFQESRRQTRFGCTTSQVHLCLPHCFRVFHSVANYQTLPAICKIPSIFLYDFKRPSPL